MRPRLTFSNVVSVIALFVALGGGAYAAVKLKPNQVKSKNIAPNAVQGVDANESSFGTVPRASQADQATNATNAVNAANAATLDGFGAGEFQAGDGADGALAGFVDSGSTGGIAFFDGAVGVACDATPELLYVDFGPDPFTTDLWVNGAHEEIPDEGSSTPVPLTAAGDTAQVHVWGAVVAHVVASVFWDAGATNCRVAFTVQQNLASPGGTSATARSHGGLGRGGLPDGWVKPSPHP
jgi:hypothetical protein